MSRIHPLWANQIAMRNAQSSPVAETVGAPLHARTIVPPEGGDWWDLLPEAAKEIAQQLVDRDAEINGAVLSLIDEKNAEHAVLRDIDTRIRGLRQPPHRLEDDDSRLAPELVRRDRIRERIERLADRIKKLTDDKNGLLIDKLKKYVLAHARHIQQYTGSVDVGEIAPGEETTALVKIREQIAGIRADIHAALSAPRPRAEVLEAARLQIAALAERGKPNVDFGFRARTNCLATKAVARRSHLSDRRQNWCRRRNRAGRRCAGLYLLGAEKSDRSCFRIADPR